MLLTSAFPILPGRRDHAQAWAIRTEHVNIAPCLTGVSHHSFGIRLLNYPERDLVTAPRLRDCRGGLFRLGGLLASRSDGPVRDPAPQVRQSRLSPGGLGFHGGADLNPVNARTRRNEGGWNNSLMIPTMAIWGLLAQGRRHRG